MDGSKRETGDCQPPSLPTVETGLSNCLITAADAIAPFCSSKDLRWFKYCGRKYDDDAQIRMFVDEAIRTVGGLPGVKSATSACSFWAGFQTLNCRLKDPQEQLPSSTMKQRLGLM
jgi:hypothetical protein